MLQKNNSKILFFRSSTFKVAEMIFNYPNRTFHMRELSKETGLSTTAVKSSLKELHGYGIVQVEESGVTTDVRADLDSESYAFYKRIFNLYRLERYSMVKSLKAAFNAEAIVLFGSFAKGEDIEKSDVDILILAKGQGKKINNLGAWERELNRKIDLHVLGSLDGSSKEFKNAVANGIVLYGYLKVV
jgi:predicted nucleotidyltransferase